MHTRTASARAARRTAVLLGAAAFALTSSACGSSPKPGTAGQPLRKITFGYIADYNSTSLIAIADEQGLWAKAGLDVSTKVFTDGPTQITALGAGDLDFGVIGAGATWLPASGRAQIIALNQLGLADHVVAQPGRGITTAADLKGKKIGVPVGTSGDMILTLALQKAGLTKADVTVVPMTPATIVAAFSSGQLDAAALWYPLLSTVKKNIPGLVDVANDAQFAATDSFPSSFVTGPDTVKKDPDLVRRVDRVLAQANDYRFSHKADSVAATAAFLKLDPTAVAADADNAKPLSTAEIVADTADGTVGKWYGGLVSFFVGIGKLSSAPDASAFYAGDIYRSAAGK